MNQLPLVRLVDDDELFATSQRLLLQTRGWVVETYSSAAEFLAKDSHERPGCLILDVRMPEMTGLELQQHLMEAGNRLPVVFLTGHGDISMAVHTMQHGAVSFLEKPVKPALLLETVEKAVAKSLELHEEFCRQNEGRAVFASLTAREQEVTVRAALDTPNKIIARELGISESTVKMHRANAFAKLGVKSPLECYRELERLGVTHEIEAVKEAQKNTENS